MAQIETEHQTAKTQRHTILDQTRKDTKRKKHEGKIEEGK